jgi:hypothetical protein
VTRYQSALKQTIQLDFDFLSGATMLGNGGVSMRANTWTAASKRMPIRV